MAKKKAAKKALDKMGDSAAERGSVPGAAEATPAGEPTAEPTLDGEAAGGPSSSTPAKKSLPRFQSHKQVQAMKIGRVERTGFGARLHPVDEPPFSGVAPHNVPAHWLERHQPIPGGYLVVYPDAYRSYSPAKAFEDGYTHLED